MLHRCTHTLTESSFFLKRNFAVKQTVLKLFQWSAHWNSIHEQNSIEIFLWFSKDHVTIVVLNSNKIISRNLLFCSFGDDIFLSGLEKKCIDFSRKHTREFKRSSVPNFYHSPGKQCCFYLLLWTGVVEEGCSFGISLWPFSGLNNGFDLIVSETSEGLGQLPS